ncbi:molybdopterin-binding protein [Methylobacterium sp. A54F]
MTRRSTSAALMPLRDAVALLLADVAPVPASGVAPAAAIGRIATEDCVAAGPYPAARTALEDGFAVAAREITGASPYAPAWLGRRPQAVASGAPLPADADTVLPADAVSQAPPWEVVADAAAGTATRAAGGDLAAGAVIVPAGHVVTPLHAVALGLAGVARVAVRAPRVRLVLTRPDAGYAALLTGLVAAQGVAVSEVVQEGGDAEALARTLLDGEADAVLVVGGTGFGDNDHAAAALARAGHLAAHGIALRPGDSAGLGRAGGRPVLLLPGRLDGTLAAFLTLARPLLRRLAGGEEPVRRPLPLARKVSSMIGLDEIVFVREAADGLEPLGSAELALHRLLLARGAIRVPPEAEGYPAGTPVEMMDL